ncbi:copper radical oxidase [Canariomyces notabilis]|uniref:Copper radical oxidase n=1 Tax=Canariomyces notabilis TaxID=2074819 RepID=A0AAN6QCE1_9PEZI|nr:copper radical oxidase [Canariomyces arenarius]
MSCILPYTAVRKTRTIITTAIFSLLVLSLLYRHHSNTPFPLHLLTTNDASSKGRWSTPIPLPLVPVAAAVLPQSGKVLLWSADKPTVFSNGTSLTVMAIYDPLTGHISPRNMSMTNHNMFCPGVSLDGLGRPIITGGSSPNQTSIYSPQQDTWLTGPPLQIGRGYHAQATLSDGRIFTIGGSWSGSIGQKNGEVLNLNLNLNHDLNPWQWSPLPGSVVAPMLTNDTLGIFASDNHAWLVAWKNASVFQAGPSPSMNWYGTIGQGDHAPAGLRGTANMNDAQMNGNFVLYDAAQGKILTLGGATSYSGAISTNAAHVITLPSVPFLSPEVEEIPPMRHARAYANSVVLPTGDVLVVGGASYAMQWTDVNASMVPELWDHKTREFTEMARMDVARTYHSVAVLLPDASVLVGGGGLCWETCRGREKEVNHLDVQVYRPGYLFRDGKGERRVRISGVGNTRVRPGERLEVEVAHVKGEERIEFAMVRYGSATHAVNTDQRRVGLEGVRVARGKYVVRIPEDPGIMIPGYWMLFAISAKGVPSVAETILVERVLG